MKEKYNIGRIFHYAKEHYREYWKIGYEIVSKPDISIRYLTIPHIPEHNAKSKRCKNALDNTEEIYPHIVRSSQRLKNGNEPPPQIGIEKWVMVKDHSGLHSERGDAEELCQLITCIPKDNARK